MPGVYASTTLTTGLAFRIFGSKNWSRCQISISTGIRSASLFVTKTLRAPLADSISLYKTTRLRGAITPPELVTVLEYEYLVLLDGDDVTSYIDSCSISYSSDKFCGEVSITWNEADPGNVSSLFSRVNPCNVSANLGAERLRVYTKLKTDAAWQLQGSFFIEKRGTAVAYNQIKTTSWGRSKTAILDKPYAYPITKTWMLDTSALAVAEEMAALGNITLHWWVMDYPILGGNLSVSGAAPIDVISQLVSPPGAIVYTNKAGELFVVYKYRDE